MWEDEFDKIQGKRSYNLAIHVFCNNDKSVNHTSDHYTSYKMEIPIYPLKQHFLPPTTTWRFTNII